MATSTTDVVKVTHTMVFLFRFPYTEISPVARIPYMSKMPARTGKVGDFRRTNFVTYKDIPYIFKFQEPAYAIIEKMKQNDWK